MPAKRYWNKGATVEQDSPGHIMLDEETPEDIRAECLLRLMATGQDNLQGLLILTFTPLDGLTDIVLTYLPGGKVGEME